MGDPILLVEGKSDRSFFEEICKTLKLHAMVNVVLPKDVGRSHDGKKACLIFSLIC